MLLLEQNTTKKERVNKKVMELEFQVGKSKKYKIETIWNNAVYASKSENHLPGLYNLIIWKKYLKKENTWELSSAIQYLKELINFFHKKHLKKPIATSLIVNSAPPLISLTVKPTTLMIAKRKQS